MSIEKPANERLKLYNRFKESLQTGDDSTFYDADDLIIIIDQAVDLQDEYTEIEAIMRGYRFFPDNEELTARRAFLYYDLSLDEGVDNMRSQLTAGSPMSRILKIRRMGEAPENRAKVLALLNEIADDPELLDDEEMIQLVDCAGAANCFDWLKDNEKKLRKKTDYLPTLLYETFIVADMHGDRQYALKLLEELTELQPFNIDFWNALAQVQAEPDDPAEADLDGALNSLEFALAIDSENPEALSLKASILIKQGHDDEAEQTLRPIVDKVPSATTAQIYICALIDLNRKDEATERLTDFCKRFPADPDLVNLALAINHPDINRILERYYRPGDDFDSTMQTWHTWADNLYREGRLLDSIIILEFLHRHDTLASEGYRRLFSALYTAGKYDRCIELYNELAAKKPSFLLTEMVVAMMMSYLRKGNKDDAKKALKEVSSRFPMNLTESWTMSTSIESIGMSNFMAALKAMIDGHDAMQPDIIDIFEYPYFSQE